MGWVADRYGRKFVLSGVLLFLAGVSLLAAFSRDIQSLTVLRGLSGMALGAFPPLVISYLTDILPPRRRGMLIFLVSATAALGPIAIIFIVRWLTPLQPFGLDAWRWAFCLGSFGAGVFGLLFLILPESPRWLFSRGRLAEAETIFEAFERSTKIDFGAGEEASAPLHAQPAGPTRSGRGNASIPARVALVASLFFLSPWATVAFPLLTGAILVEKGFQLSDTLFYGVATFGPLLGLIIASGFIDRLERRLALGLSAVMALSGGLFALNLSAIWLMISGIVFNVFAQLYVPTLNLYAAELFPTKNRARASAGAWAANRVGSAVAPLVLLPLLHLRGPMALFGVIVGALALSIGIVLLFTPDGRAGRTVE
jgi:putative MFS transporter